jgi:hypothetical protein
MLKIEYFEGVSRLDVIDFDGTQAEAARAAAAGLKAWDVATEARIVDEAGKVLAVVLPE